MSEEAVSTWKKILRFLRLSPLSLAEKCRIEFGAAIVFILALALLIPYLWMSKLTEKTSLDSGRAVAYALYQHHFQVGDISKVPSPLNEKGQADTASAPAVEWIRFGKTDEKLLKLTDDQRHIIKKLKGKEHEVDRYWITYRQRDNRSNYIRVVRASEGCMAGGCHNVNGSAAPFSRDEAVGAIVVQTPARELNKTFSLNLLWIIVAGLLAGTGAVVTFYIIVQRVILRPVRQLRALVNNVAEGNLDVRSSIKTRDEYERLAEAFNKMLDRLQESQEKLRQANRQLDAKIVELSDRNIELFRANKIKSEFLANMSHEFRTPLNAILGFAEIFREKTDSLDAEKAKRYAEHIITSGRQLLSMINDLLELAKAEAGKIELHIEKASIPELCRGLTAFVSPLTEKKKIKVRLTIDETIPLIQTDPGKVQQILYNLLSNAIKFTPDSGRIEITASLHDEKTVRIAVTDSGGGIAEDDREKIFEKFRQIDGSITRETDGTGLGLAISKELASLLAGSIGLESRIGEGSTFWLDIPVVTAENTT
ncbi:MAG: ATP-binding protein [Sedimentisphaerales bacterium]|nr:ATP-binding protein [Sedimentisphaerales bacterium]